MLIIHLFGLNASGKSTILKELEGSLDQENIEVLRQHNLDNLRSLYQSELSKYIYQNTSKKKLTEIAKQEEQLMHDHTTNLLGMGQTLNAILRANLKKREAIIVEGNTLPSVQWLMDSLNSNRPYDPKSYPMVHSIYLKTTPQEAVNRNLRRMRDYYSITPGDLQTLRQSNVKYQLEQEKLYNELAAQHKSIIVQSQPSVEDTVTLVKKTIDSIISEQQ